MESVGDGDGTVEKELAYYQRIGVKTSFVDMGVDLLCGFEASALAQQ